ncbi:MAG: TetR/AcrR family transcriptional regulator [Prevotellaceae bacterium]|jgi:AcrR family transcriptional regulator|nr:TetR/AcrR family transcriptional regulator [Prevotellaceae bacterium]
MAKKAENEAIDASTEEKIKVAARAVFQKKGYAASRTRDIAQEAGINLALLNYYFRSKEKLFELIMFDTMVNFFQCMTGALDDKNTSFEIKIELLAANYINLCVEFPDIPLFILSEIRNRPENLFDKLPARHLFRSSVFVRQFQEKVAAGEINEPDLLHFVMNMLGLIIFPFISRPFSRIIGGLNDAQFEQLMQERKTLIPAWIKAMFFKENTGNELIK